MNVYPFIEAERVARVGNVRRACILLKVSRAAYYAWSTGALCERRLADEELLERIVAAHKASRGTYGSPRITRALRAAGLRVGRKRIARLMALRGLAGRARRRTKRTTIADPAAKGRPQTSCGAPSPPRPTRSTPSGAATPATCVPGRAGPTWPR